MRWDIYRAAAKAKWIGTVEAADADAAIKEAAKQFDVQDTKKLIAVPRWADRIRVIARVYPNSMGRADQPPADHRLRKALRTPMNF